MYQNLGENEKALNDYNNALKIDPFFCQGYINRGYVYSSLKDFHSAIDDCSMAIKLDPYNIDAYANRGNFYKAIGKNDLSDRDFEMWSKLVNK